MLKVPRNPPLPGRLAAPLLFLIASAGALGAQVPDTVTVVAGPQYGASGLQEYLLGRDYRDLWTAPIRVPVLDPRRVAGGLEVVERGGGRQTASLRLRGGDGQEYVFRSVDKDQTGGLPPDFQETLIDEVAQDQISSKHPAAGQIAAALMEAAGVLHATPTLYLMPDDPAFLGEHRDEFAGMLGSLEVRPNDEGDGFVGFAGAARVAGTARLFEHLEEDTDDRVEARAYLAARLMDFLIGDWDRHPDQWRWARYDVDGLRVWHAIPRDRDNAFSRYDGPLMALARRAKPLLVEFGESYPDVYALTENAQRTDRHFLAELPREVFDSTALALQRKITDPAIEAAVAQSPAGYRELRGEEIARALRARRDALPRIATAFYEQLAEAVEVWATDEPELAEIDRDADGSVLVRLTHPGEDLPGPYYQRRLLPGETREVRVFLRGGNDRAVVRGGAGGESVRVRVIGGAGDDVLVDSATAAGARTIFYDDRGDNRLVPGRRTRIDTRPYEDPDTAAALVTVAPRDWGRRVEWLSPSVEWRSNVGPVLGVGPTYTTYGFRRDPYATLTTVRVLYAPFHTRFGLEGSVALRRENTTSRFELFGRASQLEVTRFHGFGNETGDAGPDARYKLFETQLLLAPRWVRGLRGGALEVWVGPLAKYTDPEPEPGSPAELLHPPGSAAFGQVGGWAGLDLDTRDAPYPTRGARLQISASAYPAAWDVASAFGTVEASAATYLPVPLPLRESVLALRAGGKAAWGPEFPIQEAAFVGGLGTVRGYPRQRFLGDAALFGGAEARSVLSRFNFVFRGDLGALALVDAGRVFVDGEDSDTWHTAFGGGLWIGTLGRSRTASLVYAYGEEHSLYFTLGLPF